MTVTAGSCGGYEVWLKATVPAVIVTAGGQGHGKRSRKVSVKRGSPAKADVALSGS
ncbi:hypothetical protein [Streptomyces siamensis]|uniref:hypothetical protein n=1 Tax=Streptomyces siamensis TaxID=1274986 RepID=UPI0031F171F7